MREPLSAGDTPPAFSLPSDGGDAICLADFAGTKVVLFFYPKDDTSGCTVEARDFSGLADAFAATDCKVFGVSPDPLKSHTKFKTKHDLRVALLSDETKATLEAYGVWQEKSMYGRKYMGVERSTFLIGRDGRIATVWRPVKVPGHAAEVLKAARTLDTATA